MKLKEMNLWLKRNRHLKLKDLTNMLNMKLLGHYQYYGITDNSKSIGNYRYETQKLLFKARTGVENSTGLFGTITDDGGNQV
jgi:hypothetical protein